MRQQGIAALALLVGLLLAGCQSGAECNLVFENSDSAVGQVELVQEGASRTTCSADGSAMAPGEGVGFLLDPDDGPVTLRVWDQRGRRRDTGTWTSPAARSTRSPSGTAA